MKIPFVSQTTIRYFKNDTTRLFKFLTHIFCFFKNFCFSFFYKFPHLLQICVKNYRNGHWWCRHVIKYTILLIFLFRKKKKKMIIKWIHFKSSFSADEPKCFFYKIEIPNSRLQIAMTPFLDYPELLDTILAKS